DLGRLAPQPVANVFDALAAVVVPLDEGALPLALLDARVAARHVHALLVELADEAERADHRRARLLGAVDQGSEPAWRHDDVVVPEGDVGRLNVTQPDVARLIGREVMLRPDQPEATAFRLAGEIAAHRTRRAAIDVNELEGRPRVSVQALERSLRRAEALARHDHDRDHRIGIHIAPVEFSDVSYQGS